MSRIRIYVAGAYSANNIIEMFHNIGRGQDLSYCAFLAGFAPFVPWFDYPFTMKDHATKKIVVKDFYEYSLAWLEVCEAILVVREGYEKSKGTMVEIKRAYELNIPVFFSVKELVEHFGVQPDDKR